jgi:hypothetical protein
MLLIRMSAASPAHIDFISIPLALRFQGFKVSKFQGFKANPELLRSAFLLGEAQTTAGAAAYDLETLKP